MSPDIERLRKFSLATALLLFAYVAAGVTLPTGAQVSVLGIPFVIARPEYLLRALILASVYGLVRYFYYGVMLHDTPHRRRKDLLGKLHPSGGHGTYGGSVFFGPSTYSTTPSTPDRASVEEELENVIESFPKVWSLRATGTIEHQMVCDVDSEPYPIFSANITVPVICRLTALMQDIDYTAPVWLNLLAFLFVVIAA